MNTQSKPKGKRKVIQDGIIGETKFVPDPKQTRPQNIDAERIVLATFMAHNGNFETYLDRIRASDFIVPLHQQVFTAALRLVAEHKPANFATITSKLTASSPVPEMEAPVYMRKLNEPQWIKARDEIEEYVQEVVLASKRRAALAFLEEFTAKAPTAGHDIFNQLSSAVAALDTGCQQAGFHHMGPVFDEVFQDIMQADANGFAPRGYRSNFPEIDTALGGFQKAKLYYLAANEKVGKSALMLSIARQFVLQDIPTAIVSLEMTARELGHRLVTMESRIATATRKEGLRLTDEEAEALSTAADRCASWPLYVTPLASMSPQSITISCRHAVRSLGAKVIFVDYVQIVDSDDGDEIRIRVLKASRALAKMAKDLDVPVIALAQTNRQNLSRGASMKWEDFVKSKTAARPRQGDIGESSQIEKDCDALIAIFRPEVLMEDLQPYDTGDVEEMVNFDAAMSALRGKAELSVILNRQGPKVRCNCNFSARLGLFEPCR